MKKINQAHQTLTIVFAFFSVAIFIYDFIVFWKLKPKMIEFNLLTGLEESLVSGVGIGLLFIFAFFLLSLLQIAIYVKNAAGIKTFSLVLIIIGVLSLVFVFSDIALLSDIHKQYRHGLAQPEWSLLIPMMGFQFIVALILTYMHLSGRLYQKQLDNITIDVNIFLVVQYVGLLCALMGLAFSCLGFLYPRGWTLLHTIMNILILFFPYALAILFWLITKLREKGRQWFDEKQYQDIGKSAMLTLMINVLYMIVLFIANSQNLDGVISRLWLPMHLFGIIFLFSLGNIYFSGKA